MAHNPPSSKPRKYSDFVEARDRPPAENQVGDAFKAIMTLPEGKIIEQYFMHHAMAEAPEGAGDSASRDVAARRRIAKSILRMMHEDTNGKPTKPSRPRDGNR